MTKSEQIKALKLVLDNPSNNINETSRDLIQLVITNIELDMSEEARTNVVSFVENYIGEDKLQFSKRLTELGESGQMVIISGAARGVGKTTFAQQLAKDFGKGIIIVDDLVETTKTDRQKAQDFANLAMGDFKFADNFEKSKSKSKYHK